MEATYFLFGSQAIEYYEQNFETLLLQITKRKFTEFSVYCFKNGDNPVNLLVAYGGWEAFVTIEEEEFNQL